MMNEHGYTSDRWIIVCWENKKSILYEISECIHHSVCYEGKFLFIFPEIDFPVRCREETKYKSDSYDCMNCRRNSIHITQLSYVDDTALGEEIKPTNPVYSFVSAHLLICLKQF